MKKIKLIFSLVLVVVALFYLYTSKLNKSTQTPETTFVLLDATKINSQDLLGKVVLINFWATSCTTCVAEMPKLINIYNTYQKKGYETIAVAMSYDPPSYVVNFAETRKIPFKIAIDNTGTIAKEWGNIQLTPTTFILNKKGEIVKRYIGEPNTQELNILIEALLAA